MTHDCPVGWNANEEKLLALMVLGDARAKELSSLAGEAFFRAFIVENRTTGAVSMNFRFRYRDGKDSWFQVTPKAGQPRADALQQLREGVAQMVLQAAELMGVSLSPLDVECFQPPDDEGNWERTIQWLTDKDLIHPPRIEHLERKP